MAMTQGIQNYGDVSSAIPQSYQGVATDWYINRTPLFARLPKLPVGGPIFNMVGHRFRTRTAQINGAKISSDTSVIFDDATNLMVGDVLKNETTGEVIEVTGAPTSGTTVTIRRGVGGTTAGALADNEVLTLVGNSRTGGEVNQLAIANTPTTSPQYVQTFQHVVQVADILEDSTGWVGVPGRNTPFDANKMDALQNLMDDVEYTSFYGTGESPLVAATQRGKMFGIRAILSTNRTLTPTAAAAYTPSAFISDAIQKVFNAGGNPDLIFCSTDWLAGLTTWGLPKTTLDVGSTVFGTKIDAFAVPFLGQMTFVPSPLLRPKTAVVLSSAEVRFRVMRPVTYLPYGRRGDATEGDWIARVAIELENEAHHAWIEGITTFAA